MDGQPGNKKGVGKTQTNDKGVAEWSFEYVVPVLKSTTKDNIINVGNISKIFLKLE